MKVRTACPFLLFFYNVLNLVNGLNSTVFNPAKLDKLVMGSETIVSLILCNKSSSHDLRLTFTSVSLVIDNPKIASVSGDVTKNIKGLDGKDRCNLNFTVKGNLLGRTSARVVKSKSSPKIGRKSRGTTLTDDADEDGGDEESDGILEIVVLKGKPLLSKIFTISVAVLVSLTYVNMGCSLDIDVVKSVIKKPVAPVVGLICQYICMPLISYGFGFLFFPAKISILKMGLFTLGCSPGGGASNMWTYLLGGNLNLSITMTFISTVAALGMMPLWLFTLGQSLFDENAITIPFKNIILILIALIVPVGIGCLFKRFFPRFAEVMHKLLAPFSILLIIYIVCFGVYTNLYMFKFFTWQVVIGAMCTIWSGFAIGLIASIVFRFPKENIIAVAVETGIQNTGITFVLLNQSLPQPEGDIAAVVPVASSIMTPLPLITVLVAQKIYGCCKSSKKFQLDSIADSETKNTLVLTPEDCDINRTVF